MLIIRFIHCALVMHTKHKIDKSRNQRRPQTRRESAASQRACVVTLLKAYARETHCKNTCAPDCHRILHCVSDHRTAISV